MQALRCYWDAVKAGCTKNAVLKKKKKQCLSGSAVLTVVSFINRQELLRGPLLYIGVVTAVTLLFWRESPVGLMVLSLMCGGDGLADIVGRRYGSARLPFNHSKSWLGSLAMFTGMCKLQKQASFGVTHELPKFLILHMIVLSHRAHSAGALPQ